MIIHSKAGSLSGFNLQGRQVDVLNIEWFETNKRILHKQTQLGVSVTLKFLNQSPDFADGDVLWSDAKEVIAVRILPCQVIVLEPATMQQMAAVCYEIGNKHLPLFYHDKQLLIPYEAPLLQLLQASGYAPRVEIRTLTNQLKTSVLPHTQPGNRQTLFSKILQLTS